MNPKFLILILIVILIPAARAVDRITATIAITNAPTTNGMTIQIVAGDNTTRTWTNSVSIAASQIGTNATATGSATNLYLHLAATPPKQVAVGLMTSPTNIVLAAVAGVPITVTFSVPAGPGYASVTYTTNGVTAGTPVRVPVSMETAAQQTNIASGLTASLNYTGATNQLAQSAPAMAQLVGLTNAQTISGVKQLTNHTNALAGALFATTAEMWFINETNNVATFYLGGGALGGKTNSLTSNPAGIAITGQGSSLFVGNGITLGGNLDVTDYSITGNKIAINTNGFFGNASGVSNVPPAAISWTNGTRFDGTNSFSDLALRRYAITSLANGNNAGIVIGTNSFVEVSGPSASFTINGMTGSPSRDGHLVVIVNQTGFDMTVAHQSGTDPVAANRIITMTGADRSTTGNGAATLIYSAAASRWLLIAFDP